MFLENKINFIRLFKAKVLFLQVSESFLFSESIGLIKRRLLQVKYLEGIYIRKKMEREHIYQKIKFAFVSSELYYELTQSFIENL
jgi:hypothetical protein